MMEQLLADIAAKKTDFEIENTSLKTHISEAYAERRGSDINEFTLYLVHFNRVPNFIEEVNIDCLKANKWFVENHRDDINHMYFNKRYLRSYHKESRFDDIFYFLHDDLIVKFDCNHNTIRFLFSRTSLATVEGYVMQLKRFRVRKTWAKPEILLLTNNSHGMGTVSLEINRVNLNLQDNYNNDFQAVHETILKRLQKKKDKGLILLHGLPGTGKTSYIRYLITKVKKTVIFLPPNMAGSITNPDLIATLISNPNSVLVIEDAEHIVVDRKKNGNSAVSTLLNISDGLLADCLNIQVICSFNIDLSQIDSALMRKGRLIARYEFKELETEKVQQLSLKLGYVSDNKLPMTLANIYHQDQKDFAHIRERKTIGFTTTKHQ